MRYSHGDMVHRLVSGGHGMLVQVARPCDVVRTACALRDTRNLSGDLAPISALQVLFADRDGLWPWDAGSAFATVRLLGEVPRPSVGREQTLPSESARRLQGW